MQRIVTVFCTSALEQDTQLHTNSGKDKKCERCCKVYITDNKNMREI